MSRGQCTLCGDVVESKHRHDFVWCKCKESFLDGGDEYWRSSVTMAPVDESSYTGEEFIQLLEQDGMKKMSKKNPTPSDTLFSLDEMNEATLEQFQSGTLNGMAECHGVVDEEIRRLRRSLEDVWSIYNTGVITPDNKAIVDKIVFAVDTLTTLADMFQDAYFGKLDEFKKESEDSGSRELWG